MKTSILSVDFYTLQQCIINDMGSITYNRPFKLTKLTLITITKEDTLSIIDFSKEEFLL